MGVRRIRRPRVRAGTPRREAARLPAALLTGIALAGAAGGGPAVAGPVNAAGRAAISATMSAATSTVARAVDSVAASTGRAPDVAVIRLNGADRYETSGLASARAFPDGAPTVYLASGTSPTDAVVAGTLTDGPILLTTPTGVTEPVARELRRLAPRTFVALGGSKSIPDAVIKTTVIKTTAVKTVVIKTVVIKTVVIKTSVSKTSPDAGSVATGAGSATAASLTVQRLAGADRYQTAIAIAQRAFPRGAPEAFVASGTDPWDAVAGGSLATGPILLSPPGAVRRDVAAEVGRLNPATVVALGGARDVADAALGRMAAGRRSARIAGDTRYETAAAIATYARPHGAPVVYLADGRSPIDALTAGTMPDGPVLLVDPSAATEPDHPALRAITSLQPRTVVALGGPRAVPDAVLAKAAEVASAALVPTVKAPAVVPADPPPPVAAPTPVLDVALAASEHVTVDAGEQGIGYAGIADPGDTVTFTFTVVNSSNVAMLAMTASPAPGALPVAVAPGGTGRVEPGGTATFRATYRMPQPPGAASLPSAGEIRASLQFTALPERCPGAAPSCPLVRTLTSAPVPTLPLRIVGTLEVVDDPGGTPGVLDAFPGRHDPGEDVRWVWEVTNLTGQEVRDVQVSFQNVKGGGQLAVPGTATIPPRATLTFGLLFSHPARDYLASPLEMYGRARGVGADGRLTDLAAWARARVTVAVTASAAVVPPPGRP